MGMCHRSAFPGFCILMKQDIAAWYGAQQYLRMQQCRCSLNALAAHIPLTFACVRLRLSDDDFLMVIWEVLKVEENVFCSHLKTICC